MVYDPTIWTNREVEKPRTYVLTDNGDGTITLTPNEGTVFSTGTPIDATNMNKIETAIDTLDSDFTTLDGRIQSGTKSATGDGDAQILVSVTFPQQFASIPVVVANASISSLCVTVSSVNTTTANFNVRHIDAGNWNSEITLYWIAIIP